MDSFRRESAWRLSTQTSPTKKSLRSHGGAYLDSSGMLSSVVCMGSLASAPFVGIESMASAGNAMKETARIRTNFFISKARRNYKMMITVILAK